MIGYGGIAEAALTEGRRSVATGAEVFLPVTLIALGMIASTIGGGASVPLPVVPITLTPILLTALSGGQIDFPVKVIALVPAIFGPTGGVIIDFGTPQTAFTDFTIAGGALTEKPPTYTFLSEVKISLKASLITALSGAQIDLIKTNITLLPQQTETIARNRNVRALSIES